jgi:hypothetical protein
VVVLKLKQNIHFEPLTFSVHDMKEKKEWLDYSCRERKSWLTLILAIKE